MNSQQIIDQLVSNLREKSLFVAPEFISEEDLKEISQFFEINRNDFQEAKVGKVNRERREDIRGDYTFWMDPDRPHKAFLNITTFLDDLKRSLNQNLFLGLKEYEYHLAYYPPNTFYKTHLDRFEIDSSRTITFIFYLHEKWQKGDGGELVIYDKQGKLLEVVEPTPGKGVIFLSDEFPHEVKTSFQERRSLTGWMHTKIIY